MALLLFGIGVAYSEIDSTRDCELCLPVLLGLTIAAVLAAVIIVIYDYCTKKENNMGGANEAILEADKRKASAASPGSGPNNPGKILAPDFAPPPNTVREAFYQPDIPLQTQSIRQHMNAGQIHLHVDGGQPLKAAVPVAEWYVIMRNLRSLNPFTFVDPENKTVTYFRPYVRNGIFEVAIELTPVQVGTRFQEMNLVTGKR